MKVIRLTYDDLMLDAQDLAGQFLDARHVDRVLRDDASVLKPDGRVLLMFVKEALPRALCRVAFDASKYLRPSSNNRTQASGARSIAVPSAVLGFFDPCPRFPYCRKTTFTVDHQAEYEALQPFFVAVGEKYRELAPAHWAAQRRFIDGVSRDFVIPGTVFSSVTVNRNWVTATHGDIGNRRPGLEPMVVLERGDWSGGELVFPRFRTGADVRVGDLIVSDMHELHGNLPLVLGPDALRLSFVGYARAAMCDCGTAAEE